MNDEKVTIKDIGWAVKQMHGGSRVRRAGWNGKGMWLKLIHPGDYTVYGSVINDTHVESMCPWVGMRTATASFVPWLCSQTDLLATDWEIAD